MVNEIEHKLAVLAAVAELLNEENITWAVGASLLLYLKGKVKTFHDIDIMIIESDVTKVKELLSKLGIIQPPNPNVQYKTKHFLEYVIDDVDIDVMAGFVIVNSGKEYDCALKEEEIVETLLVNEQEIPLQSLNTWKRYYELMGRDDKMKML